MLLLKDLSPSYQGTLGDCTPALRTWCSKMTAAVMRKCIDTGISATRAENIISKFHESIGWDVLLDDVLPSAPLSASTWDEIVDISVASLCDSGLKARTSFLVAGITTFTTVFIGLMIGVIAGYYRGKVDGVLGRFTDFLLAFPSFFMIIALSAPMIDRIEKSGIARDNAARVLYLILILAIFGWPYFSRIMRSQVLSLRERDFILASRALGASQARIIFKELLPNLWTPVIVYTSLALPGFLAAEAVFSYLGIGVQPPSATWGLLISDSIKYVISEPTYFLIPSLSLILVVLSFNLLGDAIRDALDPKSDNH